MTVTSCSRICLGGRKINLSQAFAGQAVRIKEVAEKIWLVTFMHYDLGFFDHETGRVGCTPNPFEAQVLGVSHVSGIIRYLVSRNGDAKTVRLLLDGGVSPNCAIRIGLRLPMRHR